MWQLVKWAPALLLVLPTLALSPSLSIGLAAAFAVVAAVVLLALTHGRVALDRVHLVGIALPGSIAPPRPRCSDPRAPHGHRTRAPASVS
jgi:hypothetical protein